MVGETSMPVSAAFVRVGVPGVPLDAAGHQSSQGSEEHEARQPILQSCLFHRSRSQSRASARIFFSYLILAGPLPSCENP